ncbi:MAG TPA: tetratricopeptide repeat protein [Terriglobales bacterium]|nr:tetratricopeptide repeat protein [Terriglobales bacterium]
MKANKPQFPTALIAGILVVFCFFLMSRPGLPCVSADRATPASTKATIIIDYPLEGSIFPPEITPPTFLWRDASDAKRWVVEVSFADKTKAIRMPVAGEHLQRGELDPTVVANGELSELTSEQAAMRTWKPDEQTWTDIKQHSVKAPATISITGFTDDLRTAASSASVRILTSADPVGAPIFYRDVPVLIAPRAGKGSIEPLPPFAIPLIKWRLRSIGETKSRVVMESLPTCANCHSFSTDGKWLGLDMDGPKNDKGLYAIVPISREMTIRNDDVIKWSSFLENSKTTKADPDVKRFGFMSQISPDGSFVITSIGPPGLRNEHKDELPEFAPGLAARLFSINYTHLPFPQVFYPTRGILAWYDRKEQKLRPLPGADDPNFVQTSAFWSPDGNYLIFSRAKAVDPYPEGAAKPEYANDPSETQIQYDLYRIPFNQGRGGKAEPVVGASANGMSNNFPKVSPDGKWIVFVQNKNGLLMRPDSKLYIVPFWGGKARLMTCNTKLMNSWHSFSPNGRWLAFSSKARSAYTQLMLTHIDANGNDSPAIIVDNTTAANRAVNIPEFVNIPSDGMDKIYPQATEYYGLFNQAFDFIQSQQWGQAIPLLREALQKQDDAVAHYALATALTQTGQEHEAVPEYAKACSLDTRHSAWFYHYAVSLANTGDVNGAIANLKKSLELDPRDAGAESDLGTLLCESGQMEEGYEHLRKAISLAPDFAEGHNRLGYELIRGRRLDEALAELQKAVALAPDSAEYRVNLGFVMASRGEFAGAISALEKAVQLGQEKEWKSLDMLAHAYNQVGRYAEAARAEQKALDVAMQQNDAELTNTLRSNLERYKNESTKPQGR